MRTKRHTTSRDDRRKAGKVSVTRPDPGLWREALALAHGDVSRLRVEPDGTVSVVNRGRTPMPNSPFNN